MKVLNFSQEFISSLELMLDLGTKEICQKIFCNNEIKLKVIEELMFMKNTN